MTPRPTTKNKTPFERMRDLTRRLVQVPKSDIPTKRKSPKRKRH